MKAALIDNQGNVVNVIVWDDTCTAPEGTTPLVLDDDAPVSPGWIYADDTLAPPPPALEPDPEPTPEP